MRRRVDHRKGNLVNATGKDMQRANAAASAADAVRDIEASIRRIRELRATRFQSQSNDLLTGTERLDAMTAIGARYYADIGEE